MPEGPEVRRAADVLDAALAGRTVAHLSARTRTARAWLADHPGAFVGATVRGVTSHGKWLLGDLAAADGAPLFLASHFMMWGRWHVLDAAAADEPPDRRERARIATTDGATAVLHSAPVFEVGAGSPYDTLPRLAALGPDLLAVPFDAAGVRARLAAQPDREVGAVLLDQTVVAGVGNYLRAEILFLCRIDPWRRVADLTAADLDALLDALPAVGQHAYARGGQTVADADRARLVAEPGMTYAAPADWSTRHYVFRRTNLPCLVCGGTVRQKRQTTAAWTDDDGAENEKQRIIYFCPTCQGTTVDLAPARRRARA